jgi:hypothetical protein
MNKNNRVDVDMKELLKLEFHMDLGNTDSKSSQKLATFKDRFPEESFKWLTFFHEIENLMTLKEPVHKIRMFWALLKGKVLYFFGHHLKRRLDRRFKYSWWWYHRENN